MVLVGISYEVRRKRRHSGLSTRVVEMDWEFFFFSYNNSIKRLVSNNVHMCSLIDVSKRNSQISNPSIEYFSGENK